MTIEVRNIVKKFGTFTALDNVDLKVGKGELLALLGPSGSGKTTLLRIIAGLDWPDTGEVRIDGEDALGRGASERHVGFVFQHYALFRHMTVFENVAFGLRVQPRAVRKDEARSAPASRSCWISCSWTGWRTAIPANCPAASASASRWRARSRSSRASCCSTNRSARSTPRCARNCGSGCASCTTKSTSPRSSSPTTRKRRSKSPTAWLSMDKGRIEQIGTPGDVYDNPATAFVHGFIGESIVLPVEVSGGSVRLGGRPLNIAAEGAASGASKLFIRRHDMQIGPAGTGSLEGAVRHVRSFGPIQRAEVALTAGEGKTVIEIDAPRDRELQAGEIVSLQPRRYRIFAAQD